MWLGKTFVWTYDDAGNITSCKEYAYIDNWEEVTGTPTKINTYTYSDSSWGDLLTAYNGIQWSYDQIGNLTNDGTWTYTWRNGRELASMSNSSTTWNYTYDANGMRTSRSSDTKTYTYVYNGSQLTQMTVDNDTLYFTYGAIGPTTVTWNGTTYYYAVNGQGDVIGIFDGSGNCVVTYNWDNAWGDNPKPEGTMAATLGTLNPLRYRSYVYDIETELYYLQSRYYNPEIGRFINADAVTSTGQGMLGNNMFSYCRNNPVRRVDISGKADADCFLEDGELFSSDDLESRIGGGGWDAFMRSLQSAADGLNMAMGNRRMHLPELHHVLSNKNKTYTPLYKEIADRYNMPLNKGDNIIAMDGHRGRHTKAYHNFMLGSIRELDSIAQGDIGLFTTGFHLIVQFLKDHPWLPYAR